MSPDETKSRKIENYLLQLAGGEDRVMQEVREQSDRHRAEHGAECTVHPSSPIKGRLLQIIISAKKARRVLEIGCGLGYSAMWLARGLGTRGTVDTVESDPVHVNLAKKNLGMARVDRKVRVLEGMAEDILPWLKKPYDLVFEDAAYGAPPAYLEDLIRLTKVGGFLVTSNWFTIEQAIVDERGPWSAEVSKGMKAYAEKLFPDRRFISTLIPHVWWGVSLKVSK